MAITNTRTVQRIEVYPQGDGDARLMVVYEHTFDDTEDAELPVTTTKPVHLESTTTSLDADGNEITTATDVSGHDQLVQDICSVIWASE